MARINPVKEELIQESVKRSFQHHVEKYKGRITNMKATLGHSLLSFEVYMQWYPLYQEVETIIGKRLAYLFAWSVSNASDCPLCSTFFRKIIIDAGENPESLVLSPSEEDMLTFGKCIALYRGNIEDHMYNAVAKNYSEQEMVTLIAFAGQMIATNIFNNVIETTIDDYLQEYLPSPTIAFHK
jgi:hypothetical protein